LSSFSPCDSDWSKEQASEVMHLDHNTTKDFPFLREE
jgi:hypothetical protein